MEGLNLFWLCCCCISPDLSAGAMEQVGIVVSWWILVRASKLWVWGFHLVHCSLVCAFAAVLTADWLECHLHVEGEKGAVQKKQFIMLLCAVFTVLSRLEGQNWSLHFYFSEDSWDCPVLLVSINKQAALKVNQHLSFTGNYDNCVLDNLSTIMEFSITSCSAQSH